jgi:hypothetical protein
MLLMKRMSSSGRVVDEVNHDNLQNYHKRKRHPASKYTGKSALHKVDTAPNEKLIPLLTLAIKIF